MVYQFKWGIGGRPEADPVFGFRVISSIFTVGRCLLCKEFTNDLGLCKVSVGQGFVSSVVFKG